MEFSVLLLAVNLLSTFYLVGLIWMVQIVHYPLFALVGEKDFGWYQKQHQNLITFVVGPPMLIELLSSVLLAWFRPPGVSDWVIFAGIGLVIAIWVSTAVVQVPCHGRLVNGFQKGVHQRLVRSNWIRTIAWTARGALTAWMLCCVLKLQQSA